VTTVCTGHQPQSVLQMVAAGPPAFGGGAGWGAKFWARTGAAASSSARASGTRRMVYYIVMPRPLVTIAMLLALATAAAAAPAAPGFRVKTLDGRTLDSTTLIGRKVVVLRFQASYCRPCAREAAALGGVIERYRERDVQFIAVHVQDTLTDTRAFVRAHHVTCPVALDPRLTLGNRFGFKGTPYTVVIDRRGEIAARLTGEGAPGRLPKLLDALLAKPA